MLPLQRNARFAKKTSIAIKRGNLRLISAAILAVTVLSAMKAQNLHSHLCNQEKQVRYAQLAIVVQKVQRHNARLVPINLMKEVTNVLFVQLERFVILLL
jgi:hypothetical protein